jgi:AraC-like DNA-binding protein
MRLFALNMKDLERKFSSTFPLSRFGMVYSHRNQFTTFTNKLEFCLRYSSSAEYAVDIIDGKKYRTPYPHVIMKLPSFVHSYKIVAPRDAIYFQYSPDSEDAMRTAGLLDPPWLWQVEMTPELNTLLHKMQELSAHSNEAYVTDWLDITALQIVEKLLAQREAHDTHPKYIEAGIRRIASYFNLHFTENIDMDALLAANGFSRRNFFRHWRKFYKTSPAEYIRELKLQHARTMLRETNRPVYQITSELNFQNSHYLCNLFKKRFGITPNQYRKQDNL